MKKANVINENIKGAFYGTHYQELQQQLKTREEAIKEAQEIIAKIKKSEDKDLFNYVIKLEIALDEIEENTNEYTDTSMGLVEDLIELVEEIKGDKDYQNI